MTVKNVDIFINEVDTLINYFEHRPACWNLDKWACSSKFSAGVATSYFGVNKSDFYKNGSKYCQCLIEKYYGSKITFDMLDVNAPLVLQVGLTNQLEIKRSSNNNIMFRICKH